MIILNHAERKYENLRDDFLNMFRKDLNAGIKASDIVAILRFPGKEGTTRPVIVNVRNSDVNINIVR